MTAMPIPRPRVCSGYTLLLEPGHRVSVCSCHFWQPVAARPSLRVLPPVTTLPAEVTA